MNVGIDSMVLIYAGLVPAKGKIPNKRSELTVRAKLLLHRAKSDVIILPTIAMSEVLIRVPASRKGLLVSKLSDLFVCATFDLRAAAIAAELWANHNKLPKNQKYDSRHTLRADTLIVATAKSAGASVFYTHDSKCRALAGTVMEGRDLPTSDPDDMFARGDIERGEL